MAMSKNQMVFTSSLMILQVPTLFEGANGAKNAPGLTAAAPCCTHCEKGPVELGRRGLASTCLGKLDVT